MIEIFAAGAIAGLVVGYLLGMHTGWNLHREAVQQTGGNP